MNFRGGEFSTGEMENFHPALTNYYCNQPRTAKHW